MTLSKTDQTIIAYDNNAQNYAAKFNYFETYQKKIIDFTDKHITANNTILDLGCGPANNVRTILEHVPSCCFTGIDLSSQFIALATKSFPKHTFLQQDIRTLKLQSQFDVIVASFCIVHLNTKEATQCIADISKYLLTKGALYLSFMEGQGSGFETTSFSKDDIFFNYYSVQKITQLLQDNGMEIIEVSKEEYVETDGSITNDVFIYAQKTVF